MPQVLSCTAHETLGARPAFRHCCYLDFRWPTARSGCNGKDHVLHQRYSALKPLSVPRRQGQSRVLSTSTMAVAESPSCTTVRFTNPVGEMLVGTLVETMSGDTVVLCHGYMSNRNRGHMPAIAEALAQAGVCSLRFDFSGNGESEGTFDYCAYSKEVEDIRAAVEYLRSVGKKVKGLLGHSSGGAEVLLYSAKYDDVPLVVNISGRFIMTRGITERFGDDIFDRLRRGGCIEMQSPSGLKWQLTEKSMMERLNTDMALAARSIQKTKVLTVHGSADEIIPVEDAHEFDRLIGTHMLHVIQGADHKYSQPQHGQQLIQVVVDFLSSSDNHL